MIKEIKNNKFIVATYLATKGRFVTAFTKNKQTIEAHSIEGLTDATQYNSKASAARAIRKRRKA